MFDWILSTGVHMQGARMIYVSMYSVTVIIPSQKYGQVVCDDTVIRSM